MQDCNFRLLVYITLIHLISKNHWNTRFLISLLCNQRVVCLQGVDLPILLKVLIQIRSENVQKLVISPFRCTDKIGCNSYLIPNNIPSQHNNYTILIKLHGLNLIPIHSQHNNTIQWLYLFPIHENTIDNTTTTLYYVCISSLYMKTQ